MRGGARRVLAALERGSRVTGCDRILAELATGPKTAAHLYAETFTVVHSRVSELRARGHVITCEQTEGEKGPGAFLYTLVSSPAAGLSSSKTPETAEQQSITDHDPHGRGEQATTSEQLTFFELVAA